MHRTLAFLAIGLIAAACATTRHAQPLEEALAAAPDDTARGRILYERSCARCHSLYMPASFFADEWKFYVGKYGRRARLDKQEQALVHRYLAGAARTP